MINGLRRLSPRTLVLILGTVVIAVLGYWLGHHMTWREEEIDTGPSAAARKDPFLAAHRFLQRQGMEAQTLRSFTLLDNLRWQDQPLSPGDTVILLNAHKLLRGERLKSLLAWVERGGTVIASTDNPFVGSNTESRDLLFEYFGVEIIRPHIEENFADFDDGNEETDEEAGSADDSELTAEEKRAAAVRLRCNLFIDPQTVNFPHTATPLQIDYSNGNRFDYFYEEPHFKSGDNDGLHLAFFYHGQGRVVINSDNHIWSNNRIDCHDHAYLLWQLISQRGKVWFLINQEAPSLWTILWRAAPYGMTAALLALALWLWAKALRFGPVLSRHTTGRRSLAEHIHASAMLLWRRQQHPHLVTMLRTDIRRTLAQQHPAFAGWTAPEQINYLQPLTSLSAAQLNHALFSDQLQSPRDFTEAVACLQTLRKSI